MYDYKEIGRRLKEKRQSLNRELSDIVEEIKIFERYLEAIEEGNLDGLPSKVYYNLFVRSYASELGMDPDELLEDAMTEDIPPEKNEAENAAKKSPPAKAVSKPDNYTSPIKLILFIIVFVIIAFVIIVIISKKAGEDAFYEPPVEISQETSDKDLIIKDTLVDTASFTSVSGPSVQPEIEPPVKTVPELPPMKMDITVSELSWILVLADGDTALHRNLPEGATRTLRARERFNLSIGNPGAVELKINDTLLRPLSPTGNPVMGIIITRANKNDFFIIEEDSLVGQD